MLNRRRRVALSLVIAGAIGLVAGAAASSRPNAIKKPTGVPTIPLLRMAWPAPINSLDPAREYQGPSYQTAGLGLEHLLKYDDNGQIKPNLATSWKQPNPFNYQYTLRRGVRFWDGTELTSADVVNALNYYRFPRAATLSTGGWRSVRDIKATGKYTFRVTLKRKDASWQSTLATQGWIFQKKFADEHPGTMGRPGVLTMGTGPWKFDSLDPTRGVELSANPRWWGGRVPIQRISMSFIGDPTAQALALRSGQVDYLPNILNPQAFEAASGGIKVNAVQSCGFWFWAMNTQQAPWDDVHVRRAVAYTLNRKPILAAGGAIGRTVLSSGLSPIGLESIAPKADVEKMLKSVPQYPRNLAKARQEMAQSKYPNGATFTANVWPDSAPFTQVAVSQLAAIGLRADLRQTPLNQYLAVLLGPREGISATTFGFACADPDPGTFASRLYFSRNARVGGLNAANYQKPAADALVLQGASTYDPKKRLDVYRKLLTLVAQDVPYVILGSTDSYWAISPRFKANRTAQDYFGPGVLLKVRPA